MKLQCVLTLFASAFAIVSAADADVDTDKGSYGVGEDIKVSFADSDPHPQDWVGIYKSNTNLNHLENPLLWLYTCGDQHCNFAVQHDTLTFGSGGPDEESNAHLPLPAGNYIAVLARYNHQPYEVRAFSHVFSIRHPPDPASVSTNKNCYHVGEDIDVFFRSGGDAHPRDFVAIYYSDVNIHYLGGTLLWLYTCGDQHCSFAVESDTLTFGSGHPNESSSRAHFPLPAGHYRAILARGTHYPYEFLAGSHEFDINTSAHPCS
jgi:hypothetical protein